MKTKSKKRLSLFVVLTSASLNAMREEELPTAALAGAVVCHACPQGGSVLVPPIPGTNGNYHIGFADDYTALEPDTQSVKLPCGHTFERTCFERSLTKQLSKPTHTITCPRSDCIEQYEVCCFCRIPIILADGEKPALSIQCGFAHTECIQKAQKSGSVHCPVCNTSQTIQGCLKCFLPLAENEEQNKILRRCGHSFHRQCLAQHEQQHGPYCPECNTCSGKHWYKHPSRIPNILLKHKMVRKISTDTLIYSAFYTASLQMVGCIHHIAQHQPNSIPCLIQAFTNGLIVKAVKEKVLRYLYSNNILTNLELLSLTENERLLTLIYWLYLASEV